MSAYRSCRRMAPLAAAVLMLALQAADAPRRSARSSSPGPTAIAGWHGRRRGRGGQRPAYLRRAGGELQLHPQRQRGGFSWDIQQYGTIGQGTNYVFSGNNYLQIQGNQFRHNGSQAQASSDGREVELGPWTPGETG